MSKLAIYALTLTSSFTFALAANVEAQQQELSEIRISISQGEKDLMKSLAEIERNSEFVFAFTSKKLRNKMINLSKSNWRMDELLKEISAQTDLSFKRVNETITVRKKDQKENMPSLIDKIIQTRTISGKVTSMEDNEGIPGVNVVEKGTSNGTVTDVQGNYSLEVSAGATLVFSSVGYTPEEVEVANRSVIDMTMVQDITQLQELVVIGYGEQEYRDLTGSITGIDVEKQENLPNTNLIQSMRGTMAGVNVTDNGRPGSSGNILVRGQNSIGANNGPLIVLDGAIFNGNFADINQNDVASIDVLKDASATAIYGARAANGVILITTKRGTSAKPTFSFNTYTGFQAYGRQPDQMNAEQYVQKQFDYFEYVGAPVNPDNPSSYLQPDEIPNFQEGRTIDPWEQIKQDAPIYNVELSVSGKSEKTSYFISGAYTNQKGLIANDNFERISTRVNLDNKITNWFTLGLNASFTQRDESGLPASIQQAGRLSPFGDMFLDDGSINFFPQTDQLVPNPLMDTRIQNEDISQNLFSNAYAKIDFPFLEGLSYRLNFSNQFDWGRDFRFEDDRTFDGRRNNGIGSRMEATEQYMLIENILNYDKVFGDHNIGVTLLFSNDETNQRSTFNKDEGFVNTLLGFNSIGLGSQPETEISQTEFKRVSYMARLNYKFRNRYLITLTARRDGYSGFGENNKFGLFPSIAAGWLLSEENFMQNIESLDFLKLRASYGSSGNQAIAPYQSISRMEELFYIFGSTTRVGFAPSTIANPSLGWETSNSLNLGLDFSFLNERLSGSIEFYNTATEDLLLRRGIPIMTGFESIFDNIGSTRNTGIELTLNTININKADFQWTSSFVFSRNVNEITGLYGTDANGDGKEDDDIQNGWFIGHPIDAVFDYELNGIVQEGESVLDSDLFRPGFYRIVDQNNNGSISPDDDRVILGQQQPDFRFGINNTFSYKNFTLSTFINSMVGGMINNPNLDFSQKFPERANQLALDYWTPQNTGAEFASIGYPNPFGHGVYDSRTFVRLQDVNLSYNIPESVINKLGMANASVYVSGKNLITITDFHGWDPENGNAFFVADFPMPRIFTIGINGRF